MSALGLRALVAVLPRADGAPGDGGPDLPPTNQVPAEVRRQAAAIVNAKPKAAAEPNLVERVVRWVIDRIDSLLGGLSGGGSGTWLAVVVLVAVAAGLVVLAVFVVRSGALTRRRTKAPSPHVVTEPSRPPEAWRAEAEAHEAGGRFRDALRCRYRSLVVELDERGLLDEVPGRTTGEERAQLAVRAPASAPHFAQATALFEATWYGGAPVGSVDLAEFRRLEALVLAGRPSGASLALAAGPPS